MAEKRKKGKENLLGIANLILLIVNIIAGILNIQARRTDMSYSHIQVTKELPQFEIQYLTIEKNLFEDLSSTRSGDSLYTDAIKNYYVANNDFLKIPDDSYSDEIVALAIKQIGGSIAKEVTLEYYRLDSQEGLDYFVTTSDDVLSLDDLEEDISGNKITKKEITIKYGDIPSGRGLILPLFEVYILKNRDDFDEDSNIWSKTGPVVLVPKNLSYKNIYNNKIVSFDIREMNNSIITYSLFVEGRG